MSVGTVDFTQHRCGLRWLMFDMVSYIIILLPLYMENGEKIEMRNAKEATRLALATLSPPIICSLRFAVRLHASFESML